MKKFLTLFLAAILCVGMCFPALAIDTKEETEDDPFIYVYRKADDVDSPTGWLSFKKSTVADPTLIVDDSDLHDINAAIYYKGTIYAYTNYREYCTINPATWERTMVSDSEFSVPAPYDMTYDYSTDKVYGTFNGNALWLVDMYSGNREKVGIFTYEGVEVDGNDWNIFGLETTTDGTMYCMDSNGMLYTADKETCELTLVGDMGIIPVARHSMCYDHNSNTMYMLVRTEELGGFASVNLETAELNIYGRLGENVRGQSLIIPYEEDGSTPTTNPYPEQEESYPGRVLVEQDWDHNNFEGWRTADVDGDGKVWGNFNTANDDFQAHSGNFVSISESVRGGQPLTPDNMLITPTFRVPDDGYNYELSYWVAAYSEEKYQEHYSIMLCEGAFAAPDDFTVTLHEETLTTNEFSNRVIDLSDYAGKRITLCFRHHEVTDQSALIIDTILVHNPLPVSDHTVTFVDWDDTVLKTETVPDGASATAPQDPEREGYKFFGWDGEFANVTSDLTIKATYKQMGDANMDDKVNTGDAVQVLRFCVDDITFDDFQKSVADFNQDGNVNTGDAVSILVYCVEQ